LLSLDKLRIMKKILFLLALIVTTFSLQAQNKPENSIYANYLRFKNYYSNGSYVQADIEAKKLLKGVGLMNEFLLGSFAGRSGLMDSCMTEFNALYGKTHTAPSITISSLSYLELDSISYDDGVTWFDASDIITVDSINGLIAAAGVDSTIVIALIDSLSIDSTFLNSHLITFWDSSSFQTGSEVAAMIGDSLSLLSLTQDSTWVSTTHDTIHLGTNIIYYTTSSIKFKPVGITASESEIYPVNMGAGGYSSAVKSLLFQFIPTDYTASTPVEGMVKYDNSENLIKYYDGN
jgi:hypothetical protein